MSAAPDIDWGDVLPDAPDLDQLDAEISRCDTCHDWRWRASYLDCQQCGAPSRAARLIPVQPCARRKGRKVAA